ncbi:MAG: hypothetical protein FJ243_04265 [Nitrospira sp.]|nr:hypothetical protein [Nitrospira sp.]
MITPQPEGLRPVADLFRDTWEVFKARFLTLIGLYLLSILFLAVIVGFCVIAGFILSGFFPEYRDALVAAWTVTGMVPGFLAMFLGIAAFTFAVANKSLGIKSALEKGWQRVLPFVWLWSLLGFIITGGFFLFFIPGVIFAVWFVFSQFILVAEDERGMNAILKSKEYVKGMWFDVFLRLLVIWLVGFGIGLIPFIGGLLLIGFYPFMMIFTYLVYEDLSLIKGKGMVYSHSSGEKFKWIGLGALGYIIFPLIIIAFLGALIGIPLLVLLGIAGSQ